MSILQPLKLPHRFSICRDRQYFIVRPAFKSPAFSDFNFSRHSVTSKAEVFELELNCCFNNNWSAIQCNGKHSGQEEDENMMAQVFAKERSSALAALALGLLSPCDALAETCTDNTGQIFNMPLLFGIALIGATVGGLLARQRRFELERLNSQLRQINTALRRQVRIESYAPNLSYAPVGRTSEIETKTDTRRDEMMSKLREGKKALRFNNPKKAFEEFKAALEIAESLGDATEAKKAARGLGASCQQQRKYREAIKYHSTVLSISEKTKEHSGSTEAYGAIADCYTELGDLETAAKYYDNYIERLETD
ncbi:hypothetical protein SUGI_0343660 [Cryptomeria japonica]|uniref:protein FLUORESCENT IN BLUE LIGHT, chloroplastic n=1 Tax=Cryptomeria japonica TaxID=3369 RepID=UPI002408DB3F|nr:protein FLUORESCENT IN BLUE LIGHT, chloroplastic [Cryptomeria japonica]GLJ19135.1 hypothetical protein SUGI_0343660 [Cryptomeria japonica]